jgi:hypothetical protein
MKIVLATPLYPPDTAIIAVYCKELAHRLKDHHEVSIVSYTPIPEKLDGVKTVSANRLLPLPLRLFSFMRTLWKARGVDIIYAQNGASVELPLALMSRVMRTPIVFHLGDAHAVQAIQNNNRLSKTFNMILNRSAAVISPPQHRPLLDNNAANVTYCAEPIPKPEVLPFQNTSDQRIEDFTTSWQEHISILETTFNHVTK